MADIKVTYAADLDGKFRAKVRAASQAVSDLTIPLRLISKDFYASEVSIFALNGPGQYPDFKKPGDRLKRGIEKGPIRPGHQGDDKTPYQRRKLAKYGFDYPLLRATGTLMASILNPDAPGSINVVGPRNLVIGTTVPYGVFHQSDAPRKKIPERKFLFIGPEAPRFATRKTDGRLSRWMGIMDSYIAQKLTFGQYKAYKAAE